ncbi:MAG: hypothetical protein RIS47_139 [Bacteroidota bacterium]
MLARSLISEIVPVLRTSDTGKMALSIMDVFKVSHLPIVNSEEFLGLITDSDIYNMNMADEPIGDHTLSLFRPFVYGDQHIYEVIEVASRLNLSVIPVVERDEEYLGVITLIDLVKHFSMLICADSPGGVVMLEMHTHDYSLTEISQIVEGNDAKVLSLYVSTHPDSMMVNLTLKINRMDLSAIIQSFERYGYSIVASYSENEYSETMLNSRYEEFINYLNI